MNLELKGLKDDYVPADVFASVSSHRIYDTEQLVSEVHCMLVQMTWILRGSIVDFIHAGPHCSIFIFYYTADYAISTMSRVEYLFATYQVAISLHYAFRFSHMCILREFTRNID